MTIKEVAEMAGVSPAAVSRYMNGGSISEEKSEKIREVIEKTGYRPNPMAQTMRTGKGGQIGVIVPKLYSDSVSQIMDGISDRLREKNFMTMLGVTEGKKERELRYLTTMQNSQVDGIILMGTTMSPLLRDAITGSGKPVVVTGQDFEGIPCVYHDDFNAVKDLTGRMIERGRKKLVFIGATEEDEAAGRNRRLGCLAAWKEAGFNPERLRCAVSEFNSEGGARCMQELLMADPDIDGVICATDRIALGAMQVIQKTGRKIPDDISIAGVGDSWADTLVTPNLTSVHLYFRQCGVTAADILLRLIEDNTEGSTVTQTKLEYTIVERGSI